MTFQNQHKKIKGHGATAVTRGFVIGVSKWVSKVLKSLIKSMFICVLQNRVPRVRILLPLPYVKSP